MRFVFEKDYTPAVSVHLDNVEEEDKAEVASMLRGLMCAIEGWGSIKGLSDDNFIQNDPVRLSFSSVKKAHYFKKRVEYYFPKHIGITVKRRVPKK
jgi:hypothetical protein